MNMETRILAKKIRVHAIRMTHLGKSSHIGSVLSIADILAVLYNGVLRIKPDHPHWEDRDRFILSKGHAGAGVYAVLAEKGFFPTELLKSHCQNGSVFSGHVSHKGVPGVELSTGSLGHGLSVGAGLALAGKMDRKDSRTFVLLSDGECDEGAVWEAALFSAHHKLDNLIAIVDYNKIQSLAPVRDTLNLEPFADKWKSFGWAVRSVNGHDHQELNRELSSVPFEELRPSCLIAHTVKGKGVSFMENQVLWHYRSPQGEEFEKALKELNE
jgi:transketolase